MATFGLVPFYREGTGGRLNEVTLDNSATLDSSLDETVALWTELWPR